MSCFTTEALRPDEGSESITQTRGAWIRHANSGDFELYYDGKFVVSFGAWSEHIAAAMAEAAYDCGFKQGKKHNQNKLREALGLSKEK